MRELHEKAVSPLCFNLKPDALEAQDGCSEFIQSWLTQNSLSLDFRRLHYGEWVVIAWVRSTYSVLRIEIFRRKSEDSLAVHVRNLENDGFLTGAISRNLFEGCVNQGFSLDEEFGSVTDGEEDDSSDFLSTDEDTDSEVETQGTVEGYLQLNFDKNIIKMWYNVLLKQRNNEEVCSTLCLMAHNSESKLNADLILQEPQMLIVLINIIKTQNEKRENRNLPTVRATCKTLENLLDHAIENSEETPENLVLHKRNKFQSLTWNVGGSVWVLMQALLIWSDIEERDFSWSCPITNSKEVQTSISRILHGLVQITENPLEDLRPVITELEDFSNTNYEEIHWNFEALGFAEAAIG